MSYTEQIIGIVIIGIGFLITLTYLMPIMVKDIIELFKEFWEELKND